jgi:hypothetical protein
MRINAYRRKSATMDEPMTRYEALSRELNRLRERRLEQRRAILRDTPERRRHHQFDSDIEPEADPHTLDSSNQTP